MAKFYIGKFDYGIFGLGTVDGKRYYFCRKWIGITVPTTLWYNFTTEERKTKVYEDDWDLYRHTRSLARICFGYNS